MREVEAPAVELEGGGPIVIVAANGSSSILAKMCGRRRNFFLPTAPAVAAMAQCCMAMVCFHGAGWTLMALVCHVGAPKEDDSKC